MSLDAALLADITRLVREADDHFYGAWKGGAKAGGGRPANPATDADARQQGRDDYKAQERAAEMAKLKSGAAPSALLDGERVRVLRVRSDREEAEIVRVGDNYTKRVPMRSLADFRDRWDSLKFLTPGNSYARA